MRHETVTLPHYIFLMDGTLHTDTMRYRLLTTEQLRALSPTAEAFPHLSQFHASHANDRFFCAFKGGQLAGAVRLHMTPSNGAMTYFETNAAMRHRGIAKALIHELVDYTMRNDITLGVVDGYTNDGRCYLAREFGRAAQESAGRIGFYQTC